MCTECCILHIESRTCNLYTYVQSQHNVMVITEFKRINAVNILCVSFIVTEPGEIYTPGLMK